MRRLTVTDAEYLVLRAAARTALGHEEDLGWSGAGAKHAIAILDAAATVDPCGFSPCDQLVPEDEEYCPKHADLMERIEAMQAGLS